MIFRNLLIGWRNIRKNGIFSVINIAGLSLGTAVVALILFWVVDELNYDRFHENIGRIFTVYEHQQYSEGQELYTPCTPFVLGKELAERYSEVERATTFTNLGNHMVGFEDKQNKVGPIFFCDAQFLNVFSYKIAEGDRNSLSSPEKIIISDEVARMFFGNESAVGKVLKLNNEFSLSVGAVFVPEKKNSTLDFKILVPVEVLHKSYGIDLTAWGNNWPRTSVVLAQGADPQKFGEKIINLCKDNGQPNTTLHVFPFKNERLYSYSGKNNRIQYVYQFLGIAFIIILIASINFINLSTAKADQRSPEVGIRKVLGASRSSILNLFFQEKGLMIVLSLLLSVALVIAFIPAFRSISDKTVTLGLLQNRYMILMLTTVVLLVLALSVIYPSFYLSSFSPVRAIKKLNHTKKGGIGLKNMLLVVQFILSVVLISCTLIITRQLKYINNYDLGYKQANLIYLELNGEAKNKHEALAQELGNIPGVISLSRANRLPFYGGSSSWGYDWEGKDPENRVLISNLNADRNYFETMGIQFAEGGNFPESYEKILNSDEVPAPQVILNQEAVRRMGIKDPVGKFFKGGGSDNKSIIAGVVRDFHFESLHAGVEPLVIYPMFGKPDVIIARISPENFSNTIGRVKSTWAGLLPQINCEVGFFDNRLKNLYDSEVKISALFRYFSFIAIFISCIGLFGLSLFVIERRKKEIGVRKVNGARIGEVMVLLNRDFFKWIITAYILACPVAWFAMKRWLENFAFRTTVSWWIFALAGLLALGIALLTVSWQSWQAATRNPVDALRYE